MPDRPDRTEIAARLLSENPDCWFPALRLVMLHALSEGLLTFRHAARVTAVAKVRGRDALVELVLDLAEWPTSGAKSRS